jgi:hypothetical protein
MVKYVAVPPSFLCLSDSLFNMPYFAHLFTSDRQFSLFPGFGYYKENFCKHLYVKFCVAILFLLDKYLCVKFLTQVYV